jgi:FKBP-type peptidyl-prolyl cis-trans isomerase 2
MKSKLWLMVVLFLTASLSAGFLLGGCGDSGGGGEGGGSGGGTAFNAGNGNVALFLADGPADDYEQIFINVCKVSLIPAADNPNGSEVVLYESDDCFWVDLLELRNEDLLLTVKKRIPAGFYEKIRLEIDDIRSEGGPCDEPGKYFKLPSGKIDLNPRGGIFVKSGQTLAIRLDIDANKSINLHEAGNSGKCIFRPVVFVDIETIKTPQRCPRILVGDIEYLIENRRTGEIEGFVLDLAGKRGNITVWLSDDPRNLTIIFGDDGFRVRRTALEAGQRVRVRGKLKPDGDLTASVVVIGNVLNVKGTVAGPVNPHSIFPMVLDEGQAIIGGPINVEITPATLILIGCDEEVDPDAIQRGRRSRVIGKFDRANDVFRAVAVFLESQRIIGNLILIERATGGTDLTIVDEENKEIIVFLETETPVYLQGDGEISLGLLNQLVMNCDGKRVIVDLDPEALVPTAKEVRVQPERAFGQVVEILRDRVLRLDGDRLVRIQEGATILLNTKYFDILVDFRSIAVGDQLTLFGLSDCVVSGDRIEFYAFIALINESSTE